MKINPAPTEHDRCDRCNARAKATAEFPSGNLLYFCSHHLNENLVALVDQGASIYTESGGSIKKGF